MSQYPAYGEPPPPYNPSAPPAGHYQPGYTADLQGYPPAQGHYYQGPQTQGYTPVPQQVPSYSAHHQPGYNQATYGPHATPVYVQQPQTVVVVKEDSRQRSQENDLIDCCCLACMATYICCFCQACFN